MSRRVLALAIVGSLAVWFGLAILGAGGFASFFAQRANIALAVVSALLAGAGMASDAGLRTGLREDRGNRWIFAPLLIISALAGWLPAWCDRHDFLTLDGEALRWFGVALFALGGVLRMAPVFVLGARFSGLVAIQPDHKLVTSGLYGSIRHPSYLGLIVMMVGWGLAFRSIAGVLLALLTILPLIARIRAEEALLESHFGSEYAAYRRRTARLLPGIY